MTRQPYVAGQFYPDSEDALRKEVESLLGLKKKTEDAIGILSPHAGYMYSGPVAGETFSSIKPKTTYIILGPNHTGRGESFSIASDAAWATPLGDCAINTELAKEIKRRCRLIHEDESAHLYEHSIEVQLPFLQAIKKNFDFVPIVITQAGLAEYREIGRALAESVRELQIEGAVTVVASSDMSHYEPVDIAKKKDGEAINAMLELNEDRLVSCVRRLDISMCGSGPAAIMLAATKALGAKASRLVKYQTSGDASGDYSAVVGYAGVIIT